MRFDLTTALCVPGNTELFDLAGKQTNKKSMAGN